MKRAYVTVVLAVFIVSTLYAPVAVADSIVGVVYKDWTEAECKQTFGSRPEFVIKSVVEQMQLEGEYLLNAKGPLFYNNVETGCYCGKDSQGRQMVLSTDKKSCVYCPGVTNDKNTLYYNDDKAVNDANAVVKVNGNDVGCRCAKNEGTKDFESVINNKCTYVDKTKQKDECIKQFGAEGIKVCSSPMLTTETLLGNVIVDQQSVSCCCQSGFKKEQDPAKPGGYKCVKGLSGGSANDAMCSQYGKQFQLGDLVECAKGIVPVEFGGALNLATATEAQKQEYEKTYVVPLGTFSCCCAKDEVKDANGKCVKELDDCGKIVTGSVLSTKLDADTTMPVNSGFTYDGRSWDPKKIEQITKANLECYCRKDTVPYSSNSTFLIECKAGVPEMDVLFLGATPGSFVNQFVTKTMPYMRTTRASQSASVLMDPFSEGPYKGGIVITESGTLSFVNTDPERQGKWIGEMITAVASAGVGSAVAKSSTKLTRFMTPEGIQRQIEQKLVTRAGTTSIKTAREAVKEGIKVLDDYADDAAGASAMLARGKSLTPAQARNAVTSGASAGGMIVPLPTKFIDDVVRGAGLLDDAAKDSVGTFLKTNPAVTRSAGAGSLLDNVAGLSPTSTPREVFNRYITHIAGITDKPSAAARLVEDLSVLQTNVLGTQIQKGVGKAALSREILKNIANNFPTGKFARAMFTIDQIPLYFGKNFGQMIKTIVGNSGPLVSMRLSDMMLGDDPEVAGHMATLKQSLVAGGITILAGLVLSPLTGGFSLGAAITEASIVVAGTYITQQFADKTEMIVSYASSTGSSARNEVANLVISDDITKCGKVPKDSSLNFKAQSFSADKLRGWSMTQFIYQSSLCTASFTSWEQLKSGGGFTIVTFMPGGYETYCDGCRTIGWGDQKCGEKPGPATWGKTSDYSSDGGFQPICCSKCFLFGDTDLAEYKGFSAASGTVSGTGAF